MASPASELLDDASCDCYISAQSVTPNVDSELFDRVARRLDHDGLPAIVADGDHRRTREVRKSITIRTPQSQGCGDDNFWPSGRADEHTNRQRSRKSNKHRKRKSRYARQSYQARQQQLPSSTDTNHTTHNDSDGLVAAVGVSCVDELSVDPSSDTLLPGSPEPSFSHSTNFTASSGAPSRETISLDLLSSAECAAPSSKRGKKKRVSYCLPAKVLVYDPESPVQRPIATLSSTQVTEKTPYVYNTTADCCSIHERGSSVDPYSEQPRHVGHSSSGPEGNIVTEAYLDDFEREVIAMLRQRRRGVSSALMHSNGGSLAASLKRPCKDALINDSDKCSQHSNKKAKVGAAGHSEYYDCHEIGSGGNVKCWRRFDNDQRTEGMMTEYSPAVVSSLEDDDEGSSDDVNDQSPLIARLRRAGAVQTNNRPRRHNRHGRYSRTTKSDEAAAFTSECSPLVEVDYSLARSAPTVDIRKRTRRHCSHSTRPNNGSVDLDIVTRALHQTSGPSDRDISDCTEALGSEQAEDNKSVPRVTRHSSCRPHGPAPMTQSKVHVKSDRSEQVSTSNVQELDSAPKHVLISVDVPLLTEAFERDTYEALDHSSDEDSYPDTTYLVVEGGPLSPLPMLTRQREESWGCDDPNDSDFVVDKREWSLIERSASQASMLQASTPLSECIIQPSHATPGSPTSTNIVNTDSSSIKPRQTSQTSSSDTPNSRADGPACSNAAIESCEIYETPYTDDGSSENCSISSSPTSRPSFVQSDLASGRDPVETADFFETDQRRAWYTETSSHVFGGPWPSSSSSSSNTESNGPAMSDQASRPPEPLPGMRTASPPVLRPRVNGLAITNIPPSPMSLADNDATSEAGCVTSTSPSSSSSSSSSSGELDDQRYSADEAATPASTTYSGTPPSLEAFIARQMAKSELKKQAGTKQDSVLYENRSRPFENDGEHAFRVDKVTDEAATSSSRSRSRAMETSERMLEERRTPDMTPPAEHEHRVNNLIREIDPDDPAPYGYVYLDRPVGGNGPHSRIQTALSQGLLQMHTDTYVSDPVERVRKYLLGKEPDDGSLQAALRDDPLRPGGPRGPHGCRRNI